MYEAVIIWPGVNGWDIGTARSIKFKSKKRYEYFIKYYSSVYDVMIRIIENGIWVATYVDGSEIWNTY